MVLRLEFRGGRVRHSERKGYLWKLRLGFGVVLWRLRGAWEREGIARTRRKEKLLGERGFGRYGGGAQELREGSPKIPEAFARGSFVSITIRSGYDVSGYVCDRDGSGLLLDIRDPSGDPSGYEFLPWSSIERVKI